MMKEEEEIQDYQTIWDVYVRDQIDWLTNHYRKQNVPNSHNKIQDIRKLFRQLRTKISASKFNQNDSYFKKFAKRQKDKYTPNTSKKSDFSLKFTKEQIKQSIYSVRAHQQQSFLKHHACLENQQNQINQRQSFQQQQCQDILYNNHKSLVIYLTNQRFSFQNIAMHIIRQKQETQSFREQLSFDFAVEKGILHGKEIGKWQINNNTIFYIFMRDISNAILELEQFGILHADIQINKFQLFNCSQEELKDMKNISTKGSKIKFKLSDFKSAFFMKDNNLPRNTQTIVESIRKKLFHILNNPFGPFITKIPNFNKKLDKQTYKQFHSASLLQILNDIETEGNKIQIKQQFKKMIKERRYSEIIQHMNKLLKEQ